MLLQWLPLPPRPEKHSGLHLAVKAAQKIDLHLSGKGLACTVSSDAGATGAEPGLTIAS
jgi:hypothetical protein